jgi:hypothetical protein
MEGDFPGFTVRIMASHVLCNDAIMLLGTVTTIP